MRQPYLPQPLIPVTCFTDPLTCFCSNQGSYYYNQLAALQILVNDTSGANATIQKYFSTLYKNQIGADGEQVRCGSCVLKSVTLTPDIPIQPFEAVRTRNYHYRTFNIAAMIVRLYPSLLRIQLTNQKISLDHAHAPHAQTNARLGSHLGFDAWNLTTSSGSTIKSALDFTISLGTGNNTSCCNSSEEDSTTMLLFLPSVGAGAIVYGDEDDGDTRGRYVAFLENEEVNYPAQPWFFWNQPLDDSGWVSARSGSDGPGPTTTSSTASPSEDKGTGKNGAERGLLGPFGRLFLGASTLVSLHILFFA